MPKVLAPITPANSTDSYPTHYSKYGQGGHQEVTDIVERDLISNDRRREGMTVFVISDGIEYRLIGGIANSNWIISSSNKGIVTIDFGSTPTNEGSVVIIGQSGILSESNIQAFIVARSTADNDEMSHKLAGLVFRLIPSDIIEGVGFTINVFCTYGMVRGTFKIDWRWS